MKRFLVLAVLLLVLPLGAQNPQPRFGPQGPPGPHMTKRAVFRVVPMRNLQDEQARTAEILELLRTMAITRAHISSGDPIIRQQLELESRLTEAVRSHLDYGASDEGKSGTALAVQRRLNEVQGQAMCATCHGSSAPAIVATR